MCLDQQGSAGRYMPRREYVSKWPIKSSKPSKQRKAYFNAPLHKRQKFVTAPLAKPLQKELGIKRLPVRRGDTVLIVRGDFKGHEGKVVKVDLKRLRIYVEGAVIKKPTGETVYYPIHPSKVVITKLDLSDPRRREIIERKRKMRELFLQKLREFKEKQLQALQQIQAETQVQTQVETQVTSPQSS